MDANKQGRGGMEGYEKKRGILEGDDAISIRSTNRYDDIFALCLTLVNKSSRILAEESCLLFRRGRMIFPPFV